MVQTEGQMAALNGSPPTPLRVPAWKRIGLKLKYAKDNGPDSGRPAIPVSLKQVEDASLDNDGLRKAKRRKTSPDSADGSPPLMSNGVALSSRSKRPASPVLQSTEESVDPVREAQIPPIHSANCPLPESTIEHSPDVSGDIRTRPRKKSVTFTPETKREDGLGSSASLRKLGAELEDHAFTESPPQVADVEKTKKKSRKATTGQDLPNLPEPSAAKANDAHPNHGIPRYVTYLQLFHQDRSAWKFNKTQQKDLLKHLFDIDRVPPQLNVALSQYIQGLQGAHARQRIIESSQAILQEITENDSDQGIIPETGSADVRRSAYSDALRRLLQRYEQSQFQRNEYDDQQIEEMRQKAERGKRAEALLIELLGRELYPNPESIAETEAPSVPKQNTGVDADASTSTSANTFERPRAGSKRKKRKSRTQASPSDSSSED